MVSFCRILDQEDDRSLQGPDELNEIVAGDLGSDPRPKIHGPPDGFHRL